VQRSDEPSQCLVTSGPPHHDPALDFENALIPGKIARPPSRALAIQLRPGL
jgi:hypothetical protein